LNIDEPSGATAVTPGMFRPIRYIAYSRLVRAMSAAVKCITAFDAMSDDFAAAMRALGSECMDRALEAVERCERPPSLISNALSYSFPQVSHRAICFFAV
jgi:hypothetical protein